MDPNYSVIKRLWCILIGKGDKYAFLCIFVPKKVYAFCWQDNTKQHDVNAAFYAQSDTL